MLIGLKKDCCVGSLQCEYGVALASRYPLKFETNQGLLIFVGAYLTDLEHQSHRVEWQFSYKKPQSLNSASIHASASASASASMCLFAVL